MSRTLSPFALIGIAGLCAALVPFAAAQPCGNPWSVSTSAGPAARRDYAAAYDAARNKVVVFGGEASGALLSDTWEWTAAGPGGDGTWTRRKVTGPSARSFAGMAYDTARQRIVLFGGKISTSGLSNQTWEWDGAAWSQIQTPSSPTAMQGTLLAYDAARQRTLLVSTLTSNLSYEYDGATWTPVPNAPFIPADGVASMAYDAARSRMVLVGPVLSTGGANMIGTFERSGTSWTLMEIGLHKPYPWTGPQLTYDPVLQRVIAIDNSDPQGSSGVWSWDGATWIAHSTSGALVLDGVVPVADAAGGQLVLLGGVNFSGVSQNVTRLYRTGVRSGPAIANHGPRNATIYLDELPLVLHADPVGSATVQWRRNGINLFDGGSYSGVTTPALAIAPDDVAVSGKFDAVVTDSCGSTLRPVTQVFVACYPNCNGSTGTPLLTAEDFQCFIDKYAGGCPGIPCYANCDGSTVAPYLTANDFQCYINKWAAQCH